MIVLQIIGWIYLVVLLGLMFASVPLFFWWLISQIRNRAEGHHYDVFDPLDW